jgi:hypothetical protein
MGMGKKLVIKKIVVVNIEICLAIGMVERQNISVYLFEKE